MAKVTVTYGQTWADIAMQELGDAERQLELAFINGRSLTDVLQSGEVIEVPAFDLSKKQTVQLFTNSANKPASGDNFILPGTVQPGEGIEFWAIENDFVVS